MDKVDNFTPLLSSPFSLLLGLAGSKAVAGHESFQHYINMKWQQYGAWLFTWVTDPRVRMLVSLSRSWNAGFLVLESGCWLPCLGVRMLASLSRSRNASFLLVAILFSWSIHHSSHLALLSLIYFRKWAPLMWTVSKTKKLNVKFVNSSWVWKSFYVRKEFNICGWGFSATLSHNNEITWCGVFCAGSLSYCTWHLWCF